MTRTVYCELLKKEAPAMPRAFYPGELGQRIYEHISMPAWQQWLQKQTMLINEKKLNMMNPEHRKLLETNMIAFLFEGKDVEIEGYSPKKLDNVSTQDA